MKIKAAEISEIIRRQIRDYDREVDIAETGTVLSVGDGIARVYGLANAMAGELVEFAGGVRGLVLNLEDDNVGIALMGTGEHIREGHLVKRLGEIMQVPVGEAMLGRVVNALGEPIDGKGEIKSTESRLVEIKAPGIVKRQPVKEPLQTGLKCIDAMTPIGRGQRELIIGDRQTGKTAIAIDTIINQKNTDVYCIYVAIGQKQSTVAQVVQKLTEQGAMDYTIVVASAPPIPRRCSTSRRTPAARWASGSATTASTRSSSTTIFPSTRPPIASSRSCCADRRDDEAYPGDVFYLHSRLLERAAKMSADQGGGSLTALPIIETQANDVSDYIPTNVISITDGQIFLETGLFNSGQRPAMNAGISVSRVGSSAQIKAMRTVAGTLRVTLAQYREVEAFAQFGSDLDRATQEQLANGQRLTMMLRQSQYSPLAVEEQVVQIYAASPRADGGASFVRRYPAEDVSRYADELTAYMRMKQSELLAEIKSTGALGDATRAKLDDALNAFGKIFQPSGSAA